MVCLRQSWDLEIPPQRESLGSPIADLSPRVVFNEDKGLGLSLYSG